MNAVEQLEKFKTWLNQADEKWLDAFASQNFTLIAHLSEMWQRFQTSTNSTLLENDMLILQPTEITPIQKKRSHYYTSKCEARRTLLLFKTCRIAFSSIHQNRR